MRSPARLDQEIADPEKSLTAPCLSLTYSATIQFCPLRHSSPSTKSLHWRLSRRVNFMLVFGFEIGSCRSRNSVRRSTSIQSQKTLDNHAPDSPGQSTAAIPSGQAQDGPSQPRRQGRGIRKICLRVGQFSGWHGTIKKSDNLLPSLPRLNVLFFRNIANPIGASPVRRASRARASNGAASR